MKYRFTRAWANGQITFGILAIIAGIALGVLVLMFEAFGLLGKQGKQEWGITLAAALIPVFGGLAIGVPLVLIGQLVHVFLDQRRLLARIYRQMRRWDEDFLEARRPPRLTDRSRR